MKIITTTNISKQSNFKGKFNCPEKLKQKQSKFLREILTTEHNGTTAENLIKSMPFDIDIVCLNPSKRAINPRFNFWVTHTKKQATIEGMITLTSKKPLEQNLSKLNNFINNCKTKIDNLNGNEKLTPREELCRQVDFILFGKYKSYFD